MAEQLRVFVSHSHQDNAFCQQIVQALRDAGADVWYDEHNLGWGVLKDEIIRELGIRPVFVLILSKAVFASKWVKRETDWAEDLYDRDPTRLLLFVNAGQIERADFGTDNGWLAYYGYKRIEAPGFAPYPPDDAARRLVRILGLTPRGETSAPAAPQPTETANELLTRGKALLAQGKFEDAVQLFERATQLSPGSFDVWGNLGNALNERRQWREALAACDQALALDDKQAWIWNNKGWALAGLGDYAGTLAACNRALELNPNYARAWRRKGYALYKLQHPDAALEAYEHALALHPKYARAWYQMALVQRALGQTAEAEAAEKRARELGWEG